MQEWRELLREFDIGAGPPPLSHFIPVQYLPKEFIDGTIRTATGTIRSRIIPGEIANHGLNCIVQKGVRRVHTQGAQTIAIKRPRYTHTHLVTEGLLQALAHSALKTEGLETAIPAVYDIYVYANEGRFAMEWIEGRSSYEHLHELLNSPAEFERHFLQILFQLSIILEILQRRLRLDHRDLKLDNLWIRRTPFLYRLGEITHTFPFQVILLDFGFACMGDATNRTQLNLGGVIPDLDSCPKEGRDLYHIVNRLLEPPGFSEALSGGIRHQLLERMSPVGPSQQRRSHVLTSLPGFSLPSLAPAAIRDWLAAILYRN